jgi:hypothetical protein
MVRRNPRAIELDQSALLSSILFRTRIAFNVIHLLG